MSTALLYAPLVVVVIVVIALLTSIITLWVRYQHPVRIFVRTVGAASMIGILGLAGILPDSLWWGPWVLALATAGGAALACRRLLATDAPARPTRRQAKHLTKPHLVNVASEVAIYLARVVVALLAG